MDAGARLSFSFLFSPARGMALPTFKLGLPTSVVPLWSLTDVPRGPFLVSLDPGKLTAKTVWSMNLTHI